MRRKDLRILLILYIRKGKMLVKCPAKKLYISRIYGEKKKQLIANNQHFSLNSCDLRRIDRKIKCIIYPS